MQFRHCAVPLPCSSVPVRSRPPGTSAAARACDALAARRSGPGAATTHYCQTIPGALIADPRHTRPDARTPGRPAQIVIRGPLRTGPTPRGHHPRTASDARRLRPDTPRTRATRYH
ncbi:exported hypothetical protein [Frankia sp. AiPs1]